MSVTTYTQAEHPAATVEKNTWVELALGVLQAVRDQSVWVKDEERDQFQRDIDEEIKTLGDSPSLSELRMRAESLPKKLAQYFAQTQKDVDNSFAELRQVASMLMGSLGETNQRGHGMVASLTEIAQIVESARSPGELAVAKIHVVQALEKLKADTDVNRQATSQILTTLQEKSRALELLPAGEGPTVAGIVSPAAARESATPESGAHGTSLSSAIGPPDSITGFYGRQAAEAWLDSLSEKAKANTYLVAFYIQRMELINSRFGDRMGTDVLSYCAQHFARLAQQSDQIFRWRGPALVAVLSRGRSLSEVRQEVNAAYRTRMTFEGADNSVLIPLSIVTQIWPARKVLAPELIRTLETFFSLPATRGVTEAAERPWTGEEGDDFTDEE